MRRQLLTAVRLTVTLLVVLGVVYPLTTWAVGRVAFRDKTDGSLASVNGRVVGSSLVGQSWNDADGEPLQRYFQPRPSVAGKGYDTRASGGSNLGPSNPELHDTVRNRVAGYRRFNGLDLATPVPVDAVTASGSGLDPDISVANALMQAPRVARARGLAEADVVTLVHDHTRDRALGFLGEKAVNVLQLNLALDAKAR